MSFNEDIKRVFLFDVVCKSLPQCAFRSFQHRVNLQIYITSWRYD